MSVVDLTSRKRLIHVIEKATKERCMNVDKEALQVGFYCASNDHSQRKGNKVHCEAIQRKCKKCV
jgi:hypothetical protein